MLLVTILLVASVWTAIALVVAGLCWAAKRGDEAVAAEAMPFMEAAELSLGTPVAAAVPQPA